nr:proton-conducting transporter membrane subunit [Methanocalculus sp. AMF5]
MPLISMISSRLRNIWVLIVTAATVGCSLLLTHEVLTKGTVIYAFGAPDPSVAIPFDSAGIPIRILFVIDPMSACMVLVAAVMMAAVLIYSMTAEFRQTGEDIYYTLFLLMMAGIFGMVTTGDLFNFIIFLEINSLAGIVLVAYRINHGLAVEGALKYGFVSKIAALFLLFAVGILYGQYNSLNIAYIASVIEFSGLSLVAAVIMVTSLAMKAGSVPMHFWTPDTYSSAPSSIIPLLIVSSIASLYAIFRITFTLFGLTLNVVTIGWILIILGILSMFIGITMAIAQDDIKRLLAYHSVSQVGYMLTGLGVGITVLGSQPLMDAYGLMAIEGGIFHMMNYILFKGLLFLAAGAVIYRCKTRNLKDIRGLGRTMKVTMCFYIIGTLAIVGIPPFNGHASKKLLYESLFAFNPFISVIAIVVSFLTLVAFSRVFYAVFIARSGEHPNVAVKEVPLLMLVGMGMLALLVILSGVFEGFVLTTFIEPAALGFVDRYGYIAAVMGEP